MVADSALKFGCPIPFEDRWQGRLTSVDISEDWEILNFTVTSGMLFARSSVKLPFSAATRWDDDRIAVAANSFKAFARELPPLATPSRPLSGSTPVALQGARLAGLMVGPTDRRASELLLALGPGRRLHRIPVSSAHFEGKSIAIEIQPAAIPTYEKDSALEARIRNAITEDSSLPSDEKQAIEVTVANGYAKVTGNARTRATVQRLRDLAVIRGGLLGVQVDVREDGDLEFAVANALHRSGISRRSSIHPRSNLGAVTLYGHVSAPAVIDDAARVASEVPGVRSVTARLRLEPATAAA
jgi:osmotically-inducible protein OsmY